MQLMLSEKILDDLETMGHMVSWENGDPLDRHLINKHRRLELSKKQQHNISLEINSKHIIVQYYSH